MHACVQIYRYLGRYKVLLDPNKTDRELFESLPLGDTWDDADLASCFMYMHAKIDKNFIPESWLPCIDAFVSEIKATVPGDPALVAEYNQLVKQR